MIDNALSIEASSSQFQWSFLVTRYKEGSDWVIYHWGNTQNVVITDKDHSIYKILESNKKVFQLDINSISHDEMAFLADNGFLVSSQQEVIYFVEDKYRLANSEKKLELILMVANQACNFSCVYCYEDHNQKHRMGNFEAEAILRFVKNYRPNNLAVDYFGGEPLLNHRFVTTFNRKIIEVSEPRFEFSSSIVTNGYLLSVDLFLELLKVRVTNFQITIDGIQSDHDSLRPLKNGNGTFGKIIGNLRDISRLPSNHGFLIIVRVNFNEETASQEKMDAFLALLEATIGFDPRFSINPHVIANWKGDFLNRVPTNSLETERRYLQLVVDRQLNPFNMLNYSSPESNSCYADKCNSFVVFPAAASAQGNVLPLQKCTVGLSEEKNSVGSSGFSYSS